MEDSDEEFSEEGHDDQMEVTKEFLELLKKERKKLKETGLDVDFMIEEIERHLEEAMDSKAHLDDLKKQILMSMSESLIGQKGASCSSNERLDMAAKQLRKDEDVQEYFRRIKRRARKPESGSSNA